MLDRLVRRASIFLVHKGFNN
jgi:hypothetical protein